MKQVLVHLFGNFVKSKFGDKINTGVDSIY